jgi:hypothetical protein
LLWTNVGHDQNSTLQYQSNVLLKTQSCIGRRCDDYTLHLILRLCISYRKEGSATQPCVFNHHPPKNLGGCLQDVLAVTLMELVEVL